MSAISWIDPDAGFDVDRTCSISGIDWVAKTAASSGRPSVASVSLESGAFEPGDAAVANVINFLPSARPSADVPNS